ncbi:MAG: MlaD family protein, partial [Deltaproteobacteria bacterium]|nr:MlaD family protein [Deltaproteobacteria bacterium]
GSGRLFATPLRFVMFFESSLKGLSTGSPVVFRGVRVGRVSAIRMSGDVTTMELLIPVYVELDATVMKDLRHTGPVSSPANADTAYVRKMVQQGLCGSLNNQSLLTGQLLIELDVFPDTRRRNAFMPIPEYDALPVIPTVPSQFDTIWQHISELPFDKLVHDFVDITSKIDAILDNPAVKNLPANLEAALAETRSVLNAMNTALQSFNHLAVSLGAGMTDKQIPDTLEHARRLMDTYATLAVQLERGLESVRGVVGPNTVTVIEFTRAVREIGETARAVRSLAGTLERNPESLLLGKGADLK